MNLEQKSPGGGSGRGCEHTPYYTYARYLRDRFGAKVYRLSLDAGLTCPNRTDGRGGCAYCSDRGSWRGSSVSLAEQARAEIERVRARYGAEKYIAYFQSYTNTNADTGTLAGIYDEALSVSPDIVGVAIGTRPDCVDDAKLRMISSYRERGLEVWIEYGLQSAFDDTLTLIGRGHDVAQFREAVIKTVSYGIKIMAHVILGLPGEDRTHYRETARYLGSLPLDGVKVHNLNVIRGTRVEQWHREGRVRVLGLDEYADALVDFLERMPSELVVGRVMTDTPPDLLVAPRWALDKGRALSRIRKRFIERNTRQGAAVGGTAAGKRG